MKFLIEVFSLLIFFALFRAGVKRFLPKKQEIETLSEESLKALQRFRLRYFALLFGFTVLGTFLFKFLFQWIRNVWVKNIATEYFAVFPLQDFGLWYPSLLLSFLLATLIAFRLNRSLQKDGLSFFLEEVQEEAQGYRSFGPKRWIQYGLGLVLFLLLLYPQFHDSVRFKGEQIEWRQGWGDFAELHRSDIDSLGEEQGHPVFYYGDSLKMDFDDYNYDLDKIEAFLSK